MAFSGCLLVELFSLLLAGMLNFAEGQSAAVAPISVTVQQPGNYSVACTIPGFDNSSVKWMKDNRTVTNVSTSRVYQASNKTITYLILQNPIFADEDNYTCLDLERKNMTGSSTNITVSSTPNISTIELVSCNTVEITWSPHPNSVGLQHRLTVSQASRSSRVQNVSSASDNQKSTISISAPFEPLNITLSPCWQNICNEKYSASRTFSHPIPSLQNVTISDENNDKSCNILWTTTKSNDQLMNELELTVTSTSLSASPRLNVTDATTVIIYQLQPNKTSHEIEAITNRIYTSKIRALSCDNWGAAFRANGCRTDVAAPAYVKVPKIFDMNSDELGSRNITLEIPDEQNGAISCLFLLVFKDDVSTQFSDQDVLSAFGDDDKKRYIALALNLSSLTSSSRTYTFTLGDRTSTSCELLDEDGPIKATNRKIKIFSYYTLVVVSATVSMMARENPDVGPMLQSSDTLRFRNSPDRDNGNAWVKEAIIGGSVVFLILVAFIVWRLKNRKKRKNQPRPSVDYSLSEGLSGYSTLPAMGRSPGLPMTKKAPTLTANARIRTTQGCANTLDRRQNRQPKTPAVTRSPPGYQTLPNRAKRDATTAEKAEKADAKLTPEKDEKTSLNKCTKPVNASMATSNIDLDLGVTGQRNESFAGSMHSKKEKVNDINNDKADSGSMDGSADLGRPRNMLPDA